MEALVIALLLGVGYLFLRVGGNLAAGTATGSSAIDANGSGGVSLGTVTFAAFGPKSDPRTWYQGETPGTVVVGGQPINTNPGGGLSTDTEIQTGVQTAANVLQHIPFPPAQIAGAVLQTIGTFVAMFTAHHAAALAAEGKTLNDSDPRAINAMVCVVEAVLNGEITTAADAQTRLQQVVSDWYGEVKKIQKGTWHYTLTPAQDPSLLAGVGVGGPGDPSPGSTAPIGKKPNPCNAACTVGHCNIERNAAIASLTVTAILAGNHGVMTFPAIGAHDTQSGLPEVQVVY